LIGVCGGTKKVVPLGMGGSPTADREVAEKVPRTSSISSERVSVVWGESRRNRKGKSATKKKGEANRESFGEGLKLLTQVRTDP